MEAQNILGDILGSEGIKTDNTVRIETDNLILFVVFCFLLWLIGKYISRNYFKA